MLAKSSYIICIILGFFLTKETVAQRILWDENPANVEVTIDSLENLLSKIIGESRMSPLNKLAELYWLTDPDQTIKYATEAFQLANHFNNPSQEGHALINLCQGYLFNDLYDKALDYGLKSLEIREKLKNQYDIAFTLRTLGWLYYDIRNYDKALEYHNKVLSIHKKMKEPEREAYSYNSIGLVFFQKEAYHKALSLFKKSLDLKQKFGNQDRISETLKNIGISLSAMNQYDEAIDVLLQSLYISTRIQDTYNQTEILNELSKIYLKQEKHDQSYQALTEARLIMKDLKDNKEYLAENNKIAFEYYEKIGDPAKALFYHQSYDSIQTEILSEEKSYKLAEMQSFYETERREVEIKLLEKEREEEKYRIRALIIGVILILIIAILLVMQLRSSIKKNKIIYIKSQELVTEKLKNSELHSAKLEDKLEFRMKELTNLALFISQRNEIYETLSKSLSNLNFINQDDYRMKIKLFLKDYATKLNINEDLQKFNANIDNVNDEFFYKLRVEYPNLTDNDLRLSAQLRLNLSSKEISHLNHISVKSVEISRYRLRKKLALDKKEILTDFLGNF